MDPFPVRIGDCPSCGFPAPAPAAAAVAAIRAAPLDYGPTLLLDDDPGSRPPDGWSPLEHTTHIADVFDVARRELFRLAVDLPGTPTPVVEAPWPGDDTLSPDAVLDQLATATEWLIRCADAMADRRSLAPDTARVLDGAAHEAAHHLHLIRCEVGTRPHLTRGR